MKLKNVTKIYHNKNNDVEALKEINLELEHNGIVSILGPSGCGKTTLLHIISRVDHQFTGELIGDEVVEMIEQEPMLFETMSVIDNLLFVGNKERCMSLLETFELIEHKDKKVKNLSIGQKKRVQIIRSLLMNPDILLCDEPTASLDHENMLLVMNMLKEVSHDCCVVIVTHEVSIAEMYSDRMITMDNGEIIGEEVVHIQGEHICCHHKLTKKKMKDHIVFCYRNMKSRLSYHVMCIVLLFCMVLGIFVSMNMMETVDSEVNKNITSYYNQNIISATPYEVFDTYYTKYDVFTYQQIKDIVSKVPEIQAYTFGINEAIYSHEFDTDDKPRTPNNLLKYDKDGHDISSECIYWMQRTPSVAWHNQTISMSDIGKSDVISPCRSNVYQLTPDTQLDILYGRQCEKDNEIVVDYNIAQYLCDVHKIKKTEDLIGKEYPIYFEVGYEESGIPDPSLHFVIVGIANFKSVYENQIFVTDQTFINLLCDIFQIQEDEWVFEDIFFMIDPTVNQEVVLKKINEIYQGKDSHFDFKDYEAVYFYNLRLNAGKFSNVKTPINTTALLKISMASMSVLLILYVLVECLIIKQKKKENHLFNSYGYSPIIIGCIKNIIYTIIIGLCLCLFGHLICDIMNSLIELVYSEYNLRNAFMNFHFSTCLFAIGIGFLFITIEEVIFNVYTTRKHL